VTNKATYKRAGSIALVGASIAGLLYGATRLSKSLFERPAGGGPMPTSAATGARTPAEVVAEAAIFQVTSSVGQVDAYRDGRWIAVQKGDLLSLQDVVRTTPGSSAVLRLGAATEIDLREKVEIRLDKLTAAGAIVDLRRGKVVARVDSERDNLEITARQTRTVNEGPARFVVMAGENGRVSVASTSGRTRFASGGKTVTLAEGTETRAEENQAPDDPEKIPEEVLLTVVWPSGERHGEDVAIRGKASATSLVTINGDPVAVGVDGGFMAKVPLQEGDNPIQVQAESLTGRTRADKKTLLRPTTRPPKLAPGHGPLWKQK
jgi:Glucodextranase, domain B/FecR protein